MDVQGTMAAPTERTRTSHRGTRVHTDTHGTRDLDVARMTVLDHLATIEPLRSVGHRAFADK
ncbi:hypothetical protein CPI83_30545 (plasmid) [Rhodococcus sp. H-CA8f]|nr:hypothetical protein CPI83_30545 [Rhodococcus sp. H-CA8f]